MRWRENSETVMIRRTRFAKRGNSQPYQAVNAREKAPGQSRNAQS